MKCVSVRLYKISACMCICVGESLFNSTWFDHWTVFMLERWRNNEGKKHWREGEENRKKPLNISRAISALITSFSVPTHREIMSWPITNRTLQVTSELWLPWTWEVGHHLQNKVPQILVDPWWPPQHIPLSLVCCKGMNRGILIYHLQRKPALSLHATTLQLWNQTLTPPGLLWVIWASWSIRFTTEHNIPLGRYISKQDPKM